MNGARRKCPETVSTAGVRADGRSRPHDVHVGVELFAERLFVVAAVRSRVVRRAHEQRRDVGLFLDELAVEEVQHLRLFFRLRAFAADVVEEHRERADAERVHRLEFFERGDHVVGHAVAVGIAPADRGARVERPDEVDVIFARGGDELGDLLRLLGGIFLAPAVRVEAGIRVVLRPVDVGVHLVFSVETDLAEAALMLPGLAVKAFDGAAERHVGKIAHDAGLQRAVLLDHLRERLRRVEDSVVVARADFDLFRRDGERVGAADAREIVDFVREARVDFERSRRRGSAGTQRRGERGEFFDGLGRERRRGNGREAQFLRALHARIDVGGRSGERGRGDERAERDRGNDGGLSGGMHDDEK